MWICLAGDVRWRIKSLGRSVRVGEEGKANPEHGKDQEKGNCRTYDASERNEMVFTKGRDLDIFDDNKFLMVLGENGIVDDVCRRMSQQQS